MGLERISIVVSEGMFMVKKKRVISPEKSKELQKDWQGYGRMTVVYSLVVIIIVVIAVLSKIFFDVG